MKFYMADIIVFFYAREGSCLIYFILMSLWSKWWDIYHWRETIDICFQLLKQTVSASNWWWIEEMLKANCITTEGSLCKSNRQKISLAHLRNVFKKKKKFTIINLWWTIVNLAWYQTQKKINKKSTQRVICTCHQTALLFKWPAYLGSLFNALTVSRSICFNYNAWLNFFIPKLVWSSLKYCLKKS